MVAARDIAKHPTVYFDHGATSWPKPKEVVDAVHEALTRYGGNPGRGAYAMAIDTARALFEARESCARLLRVAASENLIFTPSCTYGCNLMLKGLLRPGDRVVAGGMEHNAVVRPLTKLAEDGIELVVVPADSTGYVDPDDVERAVRAAPTRAVVCMHVSNVCGTIQAIGDMADIAHGNGALMLVDGAQGVGHLDVDIASLGVDAYAVSGHKGILGPQGIGLLYLSPDVEPDTLIEGGTGGGSSADPLMPTERPDRYEPGTHNVPGALGLGAAARFVAERGSALRAEESRLGDRLHAGLLEIPGITVLGPDPGVERIPVFSIVHDTVEGDRIAFEIDRKHGIACRAGLHCAPWAHEHLGTSVSGAVRFGVGFGNTEQDVDLALAAIAEVVT